MSAWGRLDCCFVLDVWLSMTRMMRAKKAKALVITSRILQWVMVRPHPFLKRMKRKRMIMTKSLLPVGEYRGRRGDHPPVFQSNDEAEGSETSALFRPPYPLDSRRSYYNDPASAYKLAANIVPPADDVFFENMGFDRWRSEFSELAARVTFSFIVFF